MCSLWKKETGQRWSDTKKGKKGRWWEYLLEAVHVFKAREPASPRVLALRPVMLVKRTSKPPRRLFRILLGALIPLPTLPIPIPAATPGRLVPLLPLPRPRRRLVLLVAIAVVTLSSTSASGARGAALVWGGRAVLLGREFGVEPLHDYGHYIVHYLLLASLEGSLAQLTQSTIRLLAVTIPEVSVLSFRVDIRGKGERLT